jgi:hypothetical protein
MPEKELWAEVLKLAIWDYLKPSIWMGEEARKSAVAFCSRSPEKRAISVGLKWLRLRAAWWCRGDIVASFA